MWKEKFIQYLRVEKNYSSHTEISYLDDLTQFEAFIIGELGTFDPVRIHSNHIRIWMSELMGQGLKARSVNRKLSAVKSFFRYLKKKEMIVQNPTEAVTGPKVAKKLPSFVNDPEMGKVLDDPFEYSDDFRGHRDRFLIELLYLTGMRRAELIALKDNDIDFGACTLRVTGKRNKQRIIPFSDTTKEKLTAYIAARDAEIENKSPFLFVKEDGEPLYPKLVYNVIHNHLNSIPTLAKKSPHVLRHSFATEMLNNGAEINAVKELLGHSSLASTEVYTHVTFEELKKAYQYAHPRAKK
ncbi:tyrosine recombinase XerC [Proteiniphilum sp.]|uniref:tyrosine recombinase XerC n=1 Tax=Proteiniphilum sp. TaxID=1926877 RepID=UPI002B1F3BC0|nr:tyrosine recombinase XerC [Proteiniphilum sp.]MEA4916591.1 tyrosine recombinase XerC [Proteiniphilum sp.]